MGEDIRGRNDTVCMQSNVSIYSHVSSVSMDCASSVYALNKLRTHGLQAEDLKVFRATI